MATITNIIRHVFNAFKGRDHPLTYYPSYFGSGNPYSRSFSVVNEKATITIAYNIIAVMVSSYQIRHIKTDEENRYKETIFDYLNRLLTRSANIDQTGRSLIRDAVMTMLEDGVVAFAPVRTDVNPAEHPDSYEIRELRVGRILEWYPKAVRIEAWNSDTGRREQLTMEKRFVAIVENPFYAIMNEPNSTAQRLMNTLNRLDQADEHNVTGKMDLIIQLPYSVKNPVKEELAIKRRQEIEGQLTNSKYGIAYIDGTEKVIQLNRPVENNLWERAQELKTQLFDQLGLSEAIINNTADEQTMLNFQNRTIEPILDSIVEEMDRKWLNEEQKEDGEEIRYFTQPFKLVPAAKLAEIVDTMTRSEVMTSNEFRSILGLKPSSDPKADMLINSNLNHPSIDETNKNKKEE